jgi:hypothetical protein
MRGFAPAHYKNNIDNMQQTHLFCNYHMEAI